MPAGNGGFGRRSSRGRGWVETAALQGRARPGTGRDTITRGQGLLSPGARRVREEFASDVPAVRRRPQPGERRGSTLSAPGLPHRNRAPGDSPALPAWPWESDFTSLRLFFSATKVMMKAAAASQVCRENYMRQADGEHREGRAPSSPSQPFSYCCRYHCRGMIREDAPPSGAPTATFTFE